MNKWRLALPVVLAVGGLAVLALAVNAANTIVWQSASTGLPTSGLVRDVAFGDVNNDGQPDLVAVGTNGVVVYGGNGAGGWNSAGLNTGLPTGGQFTHVAVGDFNDDGKLDIVASGSNPTGVQAWSGNGAGTWTAWAGLPTGTYEGVALGDVDKDGRPDVIAAGGAPVFPGVHVYLNVGASFSATTPITTTGQYYDLAADFVDGDGSLDVVAASQSGGGLKFWRGNFGSWTYNSAGLTTTNTFRGVAFGDLDLDGKPELLASRFGFPSATGGGLFIYKYDSLTNSWSLAPNQIPLAASYYKLQLGDLNNDGRLDLVAGGGSTTGSAGIFTWLGSVGGFVATTSPTTTNALDRIAIGDFDRDGLLDIGAADNSGAGAFAWRDNGVRDPIGAWTPLVSPQVTGTVHALGSGDFDRDGNLDVVMSRDNNSGLVAWRGDGGNSWTTCPITQTPGAQTGDWQDLAVGPYYRYTVAPDVIAASGSNGGIRYFGQAGTGCSYWYDLSVTPTGSFRGLSVGDIDHDSNFDVVAAPSDIINGGLRLWQGGVNGWTAFPDPASSGNYFDTALGDFNNDGWLDIAAASDVDGIRVIKANSSLRSWTTFTVTATGAYQAIAVGDFNNDGKLDIVAGANGGANNGVDVWLGDGTFTTWTQWPSPDTTHQFFDVAVGDVNHDGHLDILAGGENVGPQVWLGDGAGGWALSTTSLPTTGSYFRSQFGQIDHDGNLDILATTPGGGLGLWAAAEAAPPTISNIQPSGWVSTTQSPTIVGDVIDTGSGLSATSGLYRYSTNGGLTWSALGPASISGSTGTTSTQSLTASNVPFGQDSGTQNRIEFRAADVVGNLGVAQATIKIDTVPPTAPTSISSSDHTVGVWSNDNTLSINWSGASDATSGVQAYSVLFDQNPTTLPPQSITHFATLATSAALADGNNWYAHVRTVDVAGNWSTTAIHLGPFLIDTVPPTNPTSVSSSDHSLGVWSNDPTITMIWSGATDTASGVSGYSYVFDTATGSLPDVIVDTFGSTATSAALPSGGNNYFHIRTRDLAGNWSAAGVNRGAYYIDVTPPSSSASSPASVGSTSFTVSWSGSDAHSGIANYDVQYRDTTTGSSWTTWQSLTTATSATFFGAGGHIYQFRSRARDNAGNLEAYPAGYDSQTSVATIDLFVKSPGVEVNQGVQDLNNSVTLIANKRTFVRCYPQSSGGTFVGVPGRLFVYRGAAYMGALAPSNSGGLIGVKASPDRNQLNDAFYFDVPTGWLGAGSVTFQCQVNSPLKYADSNPGNDVGSLTVNFQASPTMNLVIVDVPYWSGGAVRHVRNFDRQRLEAWLRNAYPINSLNVQWAYLDPPYGSLPDAGTVDSDLFWDKFWNPFKFFPDFFARYYGMAIDTGGFMRGLAIDIPSTIAAGPTGPTGAGSWDTDGSYGDWYGGHELGHTFGRHHVHGAPYGGSGGCGDEAGPDGSYPYASGKISPSTSPWATNTKYGLDWSAGGLRLITPDWYDVMTYCVPEWISDYTYNHIYSQMVGEKPVTPAQVEQLRAAASEHLVVTGQIITVTDVLTLSTFFRVPNSLDLPGNIPGPYHIRLLGTGNAQLADYPFTPKFSPDDNSQVSLIAEAVPWITGTQSIVILHNATPLITRTVSAHAPAITLTSPNGGETLSGSNVVVTWNASDADGDPLKYLLEYSADNGANWQLLGTNITQTQATLDLSLLPGTTQGLFRVWASDGVNTSFDASDGPFSVPFKKPSIISISPDSGTTYVLSQTVTLEGSAFDAEDNVLGDTQLTWSSSLQGVLGTGKMLQTTDLVAGTHVITLTATDSQNNSVTATTTVIVGEPSATINEIYLPIVTR